MQRDVRFFDPEDAPAAPPGWSGNIVQGRSCDLTSPEGSYLQNILAALLRTTTTTGGDAELLTGVSGEVLGAPRPSSVRLGQATFTAWFKKPTAADARSPETRSSQCCRPRRA